MANFKSFVGTITMIENFWVSNPQDKGCYKLITVQNSEGNIVNFVVEPRTYFVNHFTAQIGDLIEGFYDGDAPVPLIYPPQYRAIVIAKIDHFTSVKVDYFDENYLSSDNALKLNISPTTQILTMNNQLLNENPANHNLIVQYNFLTKSIPAQTTPIIIIVMCNNSFNINKRQLN